MKGNVSLDHSLKWTGGQSIKAFYQDCHQSFLLFIMMFFSNTNLP
ncbi:T7SS effector LXG polymorphic toxin [Cytobacillus horneckiae]